MSDTCQVRHLSVDAFAALKRSDEGLSVMDADQEQWVDTMKQLLKLKPRRYPPEPSGPAQAFVYRLINQPWFEPFVLGVILFNTLLIALDGYGVSPWEAAALARRVREEAAGHARRRTG